jgi:hypothetical protein
LEACADYGKEINRIKAKAKLQKWELDQMAKKHDEEQKKKNDGAELKVACKFMNYIEYGTHKVQAREIDVQIFRK